MVPAFASRDFGLYVCGITPYDATHLGHASTYLTFDLVHRLAIASGKRVTYTQNVTDVDDPLLERANARGLDWRELAHDQVSLFREDMQYLGVVPPHHYLAVTECIPAIGEAILRLRSKGLVYGVPSAGAEPDLYLDIVAADASASEWEFGSLVPQGMSATHLFDDHGGDSARAGKRNPLDSLLWRSRRAGEPSWQVTGIPDGRPGWHIECAVIAALGAPLPYDVQGGGEDLVFPHHDYSSAHAATLTSHPLARVFSHVGLVSLDGEKMSKSLGNLVFIRDWRLAGVDPSAIRVAVFGHPYAQAWEWHGSLLTNAMARLQRWRAAARSEETSTPRKATGTAEAFAAALARDLDTVSAWRILDEWATAPEDVRSVASTVSALTGVELLEGPAS